TETDAMFDNTFRFVTEAELTYLHVFPFSPREGTPAARMPQVNKRIARDRAARLRALGDAQFAKLCASRVGQHESVLVEHEGMGRSEQFVPVHLDTGAPGDIVDVEIQAVMADGLVARPKRV